MMMSTEAQVIEQSKGMMHFFILLNLQPSRQWDVLPFEYGNNVQKLESYRKITRLPANDESANDEYWEKIKRGTC